MSWTQVYISGLSRSKDPSDEQLEETIAERYDLTISDSLMWAGAGTTSVKRDENGTCYGFAFLAFYSEEGASIFVDRINSGYSSGENENESLVAQLHAELSNAKAGKDRKKANQRRKQESGHVPDLRLRRQRKAPIRKHPVIVSSNGKHTNLGNKNR